MTDILKRNNVVVKGRGPETMIFAHGFGCSQKMWKHVAPHFEEQYRTILFDYVGSGQSDAGSYSSKRYSTLQGYAQDILDICHELGIKDAILVGHSVSSMIAVTAALQEPACFKKLVLVSPSPYYFPDGDYKGSFEREDVDALFEMMNNNYLGWSSFLAPVVMGNADKPELTEELANSFCSTDPSIAKEFAKVAFYSDTRSDLPKLKTESLTLQCAQDALAPEETGIYIEKHTPNNTLVNLKATGHCPHISAPEEVVCSIKAYLRA